MLIPVKHPCELYKSYFCDRRILRYRMFVLLQTIREEIKADKILRFINNLFFKEKI